ncbi:MAG: UDP-N-acetylmuramate--L-alanine ligase [Ruminococcaceae bacterium]|nr:UDP-N-acetylmuramate--L-alanine ligase [Oscillospiraceae bacterium]
MALSNTHHGAERIREMLSGCGRILFIGIGGVSMSALAEITMEDGILVSGSDRVDNKRLWRLREKGAQIYLNHSAEHIENVDAVVYTVAIGEDNPEYREAERRGLPLISRSDYLGYVMMRYAHRIGIAGMNGKSTTTALCAHLMKGERDIPTVFCGAEAETLGNSSCMIGESREHFVFEACEYMDSFLDFSPTLAVLLNVGLDHVDYFHSIEQIKNSFLRYAEKTGADGRVLYNADDPELVSAMKEFRGEALTYGIYQPADFTAENLTSTRGHRRFSFYFRGERLCEISLRLPGEFQVYNTLAAAATAYLSGISPQEIEKRIATFVGVHRRMEYLGSLNGADAYADYSHHPSAIEATFRGVCEMGYKRVLCAYQPHTYSRTEGLFEDFVASFSLADRVFFADIYAARERNESGISSKHLADRLGEKALYCGDFQALSEALIRESREGDLLLIMGAGDIDRLEELLPLKK